MDDGMRYLTSIILFLTVGLFLFSAYPLIEAGKLCIIMIIILISFVIGIINYFISGSQK